MAHHAVRYIYRYGLRNDCAKRSSYRRTTSTASKCRACDIDILHFLRLRCRFRSIFIRLSHFIMGLPCTLHCDGRISAHRTRDLLFRTRTPCRTTFKINIKGLAIQWLSPFHLEDHFLFNLTFPFLYRIAQLKIFSSPM